MIRIWEQDGLAPTDLADKIGTASFLPGISVGWGQVEEWLRAKSGLLFAVGEDDKAHQYRDLAGEAKREARAKRKEYDERRPTKSECFAKLDRWEESYLIGGYSAVRWMDAFRIAFEATDRSQIAPDDLETMLDMIRVARRNLPEAKGE